MDDPPMESRKYEKEATGKDRCRFGCYQRGRSAKFMDHGWVTVNYNVARCSLIIVPVESSRVGVTTRRRLIKYTYPREGSALVRKKDDFTRLPKVCKSGFTGAQGLDPCSINNWAGLVSSSAPTNSDPPASVPGAQSLLLELTSRAKW